MSNVLADFYRCPEELVALSLPEKTNSQPGYFHFGTGTICYGQSTFRSPARLNGNALPDLSEQVTFRGSALEMPFDVERIVNNLRFERYPTNSDSEAKSLLSSEAIRRIYYSLRPLFGDPFRRYLQRVYFRGWQDLKFPEWPVDTTVESVLERILSLSIKTRKLEKIPFIWFWPDGAPSCATVTHDVETIAGAAQIPHLMDVDDAYDIKTSFQLVPEKRYPVPAALLNSIRERQCEVNVHSLNHDGNLFRDRKTFREQVKRINQYVHDFRAEGFRSACLYRNVDWYDELNVLYDMSVPNVAHLEPQRGGCCTVFPYYIGNILELPLTTAQDYSLFHILGDYSIDLWKKQIERIMNKHGFISFITHPDYIMAKNAFPVYKALLSYLFRLRRERKIWIASPGDVNRWWRERSQMQLKLKNGKWRIIGPGQERARIAYACVEDERIIYSIEQRSEVLAESVAY